MIVSIVSGTYNRLEHLKAMINSARRSLPAGIAYEFVIVDGGSTDGSLDYLREQPDVVLIEHGELRGAIKAFCDGAYAARGKYVLLANDDVTFRPYGIASAVAYLEDRPYCGGVAFRDNRPAPGYQRGVYKTQTLPVQLPNGQPSHVTFAQVGLFRKWLGDAVGWWGASDCMSKSRTYGGDNYLSARIWEKGYTVEEAPLADVTDHVANDDLRHDNTSHQGRIHPDSQAYRDCFPRGAILATTPQLPNPDQRGLRILYLPIYEPHTLQHVSKRGLRQALQKVGLVWEVDYLNSPIDVSQVVKAWQPDLVISQFHDGRNVTADKLAYWRKLSPRSIWVNWSGDARGLDAPEYLELLRHVDLQLVVNINTVHKYHHQGIEWAFWQVGYELPQDELPVVPKYDVVFLGNNTSQHRVEMVECLRAIPDISFGLYGAGWPDADGQCLYDFATACALHRNARIVIGDTFPGTFAFVSNRMVQVLGDGAFLLHEHVEMLDRFMGVEVGMHYVEWTDFDDLKTQIAYWLERGRAPQRARIAKAGHALIQERYTFGALVRQLFEELLPKIKGQRETA